jgi:hypothetical protein
VTDEENRVLVENFLEAEVKHALFQLEHNKSPGPDGFSAEFYQVFWDVIKGDMMALFKTFIKGLYLYSVSTLTLLLCYQSVLRL